MLLRSSTSQIVDGRGYPLRRSDLFVAGDGDAAAVRESPVGAQARFLRPCLLERSALGRNRVERRGLESLPHRAPELGAQVLGHRKRCWQKHTL